MGDESHSVVEGADEVVVEVWLRKVRSRSGRSWCVGRSKFVVFSISYFLLAFNSITRIVIVYDIIPQFNTNNQSPFGTKKDPATLGGAGSTVPGALDM